MELIGAVYACVVCVFCIGWYEAEEDLEEN